MSSFSCLGPRASGRGLGKDRASRWPPWMQDSHLLSCCPVALALSWRELRVCAAPPGLPGSRGLVSPLPALSWPPLHSAGLWTDNHTSLGELGLRRTRIPKPQALCSPDTEEGGSGPPCRVGSFSSGHSQVPWASPWVHALGALIHVAFTPTNPDLVTLTTPPALQHEKPKI